MILKDRKVPKRILFDEALLGRLPETHSKWHHIYEGNQRRRAGYNGERSLDHYLKLLPEDKYFIFHDLYLPYKSTTFQMDTLLLSSTLALILEVKNVAGKLLFDIESQQFIRTHNGEQQGMQDPLTQARRYKQQLSAFFEKYSIPAIPLDYLVVISFPSSVFQTNPLNSPLLKKICHSFSLIERIQFLEKIYSEEKMNSKTLKKTCRLILHKHVPPVYDFNELYEINKNEILTGVRCPHCTFLPMRYKRGRWQCPSCNTSSGDAHFESLREYFHLFGQDINNSDIRKFLNLPSCKAVNRLLSNLSLPFTGDKKGRVYHLQSITEKE